MKGRKNISLNKPLKHAAHTTGKKLSEINVW